jgi:anti-sigma regulatory factor (Ser/Thr protein kinase)
MSRLDEVVRSLPSGQIVTCAYAAYDPSRGTACLANAGHLPPVLLRPDGRSMMAELVEEALSVPLGAGGLGPLTEFTQTEIEVPAGTVLALYTDGLVERPSIDLDDAVAALAERLRTGPRDLGDAADTVLRDSGDVRQGGFDDDVALLLPRLTAVQEGNVIDVKLPSEPESAALARATVVDTLHSWGLEGAGPGRTSTADVAALLVSEVVTNAVRYSSGPIELLVRRSPSAIWFEIGDQDSRLPRLRHARSDDEGGRGLALVQALASAWGTREVPTGKVVWFRLDR